MELTLPVCFVAASLAGFIQGYTGFGSALVALPVLLIALPIPTAVPLVSLIALSSNVVMVARLHGHIQRGPMKLLLASSAAGLAVGGWVLDGAPDSLIKAVLGAVMVFVVIQTLTDKRGRAPLGHWWAVAAGFASGSIGLLTGASGPPVIAWAARQPWRRDELRATLTCYFLLTGMGIVGTQVTKGFTTLAVARLFGWSLPPLLAGLYVGEVTCGKAGERTFRRVVLAMLGCIGAAMLWQAGKEFLHGA